MGHLTHTIRQVAKTTASTVLTAIREKKVKIGNFDINYTKVGQGDHKVVLIPGALGTIRSHFKYQIEGFNKDKFTLVLFDPQGYGKSVPPERILNKEIYQRDADTAYELMKHLNIPKYSVMGWCAGGSSSIILASQHPQSVNKLVIWSSYAYVHPQDIHTYRKIRDVNTWGEQIRDTMLAEYGYEKFMLYWRTWVDSMADLLEVEPDICRDQLKHISCPTYILYGQRDKVVHPEHLPYLCHHIKDSKYHLFPEGKHDIHMKYADDFNHRVQEFLLKG